MERRGFIKGAFASLAVGAGSATAIFTAVSWIPEDASVGTQTKPSIIPDMPETESDIAEIESAKDEIALQAPIIDTNIPLQVPEVLAFNMPEEALVFPLPRLLRAASNIAFYNTHTAEKIKIDFRHVDKDEFNHFMRDFRANEIKDIDNRLIKRFASVTQVLRDGGADVDHMELISGYRSKATNDMLQKTRGGQASNSQHIYARAGDVRIAGVELKSLRDAARTVAKADGYGGVGYYPKSDFVHMDVARLRVW